MSQAYRGNGLEPGAAELAFFDHGLSRENPYYVRLKRTARLLPARGRDSSQRAKRVLVVSLVQKNTRIKNFRRFPDFRGARRCACISGAADEKLSCRKRRSSYRRVAALWFNQDVRIAIVKMLADPLMWIFR
jgi:hypothetical protein